MKRNRKVYFYGILSFIIVLFFTFLFPDITEFFFYNWVKISNKSNYLFIDNIYPSITATGFALISTGIIGYVVFKDLKKSMFKKVSLIVLLLGILITFTFIISRPINNKIGFLKEKDGNIYMYTGFSVKEKIIFIKKEKITK